MARRPYCPIMEAFIGPLAKPGFRHNLLDQPTTTTISTNHTNEKTLDCNTTDTSWRFFVQGFSPFGRSSRPSIVPIASHKIGGQKKQFNRGCSSRIVLLGEDSAFIPTCHDFSSQDGPATPIQIPFSWQRCLYTGTLDSSETSFFKWYLPCEPREGGRHFQPFAFRETTCFTAHFSATSSVFLAVWHNLAVLQSKKLMMCTNKPSAYGRQ